MSYLIFRRESNDFRDILSDTGIKKEIRTKITFKNHLILELAEDEDKVHTYVILKYGDDIVRMSDIVPNRSPITGKDYIPKKK